MTTIKPLGFFARVLPLFVLIYACWGWIEPLYVRVLFQAARAGVWLSELSFDPLWRNGTTLLRDGTAIFFKHRLFDAFKPPLDPQGMPAEWIMANVVLLLGLMLATPAPSWRTRFTRLGLALALALALQVADVVITIKATYAMLFRGYWSRWAVQTYGFLNAFFQGFDAQLFPVLIWGGIHFRELRALAGGLLPAAGEPPGKPVEPRSARRRARRGR